MMSDSPKIPVEKLVSIARSRIETDDGTIIGTRLFEDTVPWIGINTRRLDEVPSKTLEELKRTLDELYLNPSFFEVENYNGKKIGFTVDRSLVE